MHSPPGEPHPTACAVCGYIVARRTSPDGTKQDWVHGGGSPDDHPVVPVPYEEIDAKIRCDFCNRVAKPTWTLPVENYTVIKGHENIGSWAICQGCLPYIQRQDWDGLVTQCLRARKEDGEDMSLYPRAALVWTFDQLIPHILGEPYLDDV